MDSDPVVAEVRLHGARLAEECGGDVHRLAERLRREQAEGGRRIVRRRIENPPPPAPEPPPRAA